ncbi:unnamed protein product [Cyclocybe aegerita]|uniref:XPA C-terminal domain-containing protein n=1 Tax=Cyclocybe aegerita TaxID=1973307 RepID=A0A8S0VZC0_CYCAE|nr:unnamed protein product [Cyclocybe aegerita]
MGWFDDNDPMGAEAEAFAEETYELYVKPFVEDSGRKFTDPTPANTTPMKRVERPESEWGETKWPKSKLKSATLIPKGRAKSEYLLTDKDMLPLSYCKKKNSQGYNCMKMYNKCEVERRAWEKYGGLNGLGAALRDHANGVKPAPSSSSPKKTKSSVSKSTTSAKANIVGTSNGKVAIPHAPAPPF